MADVSIGGVSGGGAFAGRGHGRRDAQKGGLHLGYRSSTAAHFESTCTAQERAALDLLESVSYLADTQVPAAVVVTALTALGGTRTAAVPAVAISITAWDQIRATARAWVVEERTD